MSPAWHYRQGPFPPTPFEGTQLLPPLFFAPQVGGQKKRDVGTNELLTDREIMIQEEIHVAPCDINGTGWDERGDDLIRTTFHQGDTRLTAGFHGGLEQTVGFGKTCV